MVVTAERLPRHSTGPAFGMTPDDGGSITAVRCPPSVASALYAQGRRDQYGGRSRRNRSAVA
jgi:hypothetical protein